MSLPTAVAAAQPFAPALSAGTVRASTEYWVDPGTGNDAAVGSAAAPLRSLAEAWRRVPQGGTLAQGVTINLRAGQYPENALPVYWENRHGTAEAPIVLRAADALRSPVLRADINMYNVDHLTISGLTVAPGHDAFHCELCGNVTIQDSTLDGRGPGGSRAAHETYKANQSHDLALRRNTIAGADDNAIDFVAVQRAVIQGNNISEANDWCAYAKGGSTQVVVSGNEIHHCGTGGFTAGQGSGLEFLVAPWLTYEATEMAITGNFVHDTEGAAFGVNGGRNIVIADNVAARVGTRSHLLEVTFGYRSCDGNAARCQSLLDQGAWGTSVAGGGVSVNIPDDQVSILRNTVVNPPGVRSQWQHLEISTPRSNPDTAITTGPSPARTDTGLVISGNTIRNGGVDMPLGIDDSQVCTPANPTCTVTQILRDNDINGAGAVPVPNAVPNGVPVPPDPVDPGPVEPVLTVPGAPSVTSVVRGNAHVRVGWSAPGSDGGSTITGYAVTATPGGRTCSTTGVRTCTVTGLTNGQSYRFSVRAANAVGTGRASALSAAVIPATRPSVVRAPAVRYGPAVGQVRLYWAAPAVSGGAPVLGYRLRGKVAGSPFYGSWTTVPASTQARSLTGLRTGVTYTVQVVAFNAVGDGPAVTVAVRRPN